MSSVYQALADPTRRRILDRLRSHGALSVGEIAQPLDMTRQGVTRHLDVLVASELVRVRWEGRRRLHELESAPLMEVEAWLAPYAAEWDRRLARLRRHVESDADERESS